MTQPSPTYSLVLIGRYPGKDVAVAQALSRCLGREEAWGLRVVSAAPIIFFENLPQRHADLARQAMKDVIEAGCKFEIENGANPAYPKVGWAHAPKIHGKDLSELARQAETVTLRAPNEADSAPALHLDILGSAVTATSHTAVQLQNILREQTGESATATLILPCPYTGQNMKLSIQVSLTKIGSETRINLGAVAAQTPTSMPSISPISTTRSASAHSNVANAQTGSIILPGAAQAAKGSGLQNPVGKNSGAMPVPYPAPPSDTGVNLRDKNALVSTTVARPMSSGLGLPAISWRRNAPHEVPLPDVPVLPGVGRVQNEERATKERNHLPLNSKPMDLSAFEEQLGVSSDNPQRPYVDAGEYDLTDSVDGLNPVSDEDPTQSVVLCSVFIERSSNPIVHELVAELHGIPEGEASEMCVQGSVALAENIPLDEANDIKRRCAAINVTAHVLEHR